MAHKAHVKEAMISTNRKNWELQIISLHAKKEAMVHCDRGACHPALTRATALVIC